MSAQEKWKINYWLFTRIKSLQVEWRDEMNRYKREAALERQIAALQRENERLKMLLDLANYAAWQARL